MIGLVTGIVAIIVAVIAYVLIGAYNKEQFEGKDLTLRSFQWGAVAAGIIIFVVGLAFSSVYFVSSKHIGIMDKKWGGSSLTDRIIATDGENGIQATVLRDGLHLWKFRWQYNLNEVPLFHVPEGQIGIIETRDGKPMPPDRVYAPEWEPNDTVKMVDAQYFLDGENGPRGFKGPQLTVIGPGEYPIHPGLYDVKKVPMTTIQEGEIGVIKANISGIPSTLRSVYAGGNYVSTESTVVPGEIGIWSKPLEPGKYWIHPSAYKVTPVNVRKLQVDFIGEKLENGAEADTAAIRAKAKDGIQFWIDSTVIYHIEAEDAAMVVARVGDPAAIKDIIISQTRKVLRDKIGEADTLQYVNDRVNQQRVATEALAETMMDYGVTVDDVNIRDMYGNELAAILKTQSDREIARQQEITFEQQRQAALKQQELNKAEQEAVEEKTLATAAYDAKREEQKKLQAITKAEGAAEQVRIAAQGEADKIITEAKANADAIALKGDAEAERYSKIVKALGEENATSIEIIDRLAPELGNITGGKVPETFIYGGNGNGGGINDAISAGVLKLLKPSATKTE